MTGFLNRGLRLAGFWRRAFRAVLVGEKPSVFTRQYSVVFFELEHELDPLNSVSRRLSNLDTSQLAGIYLVVPFKGPDEALLVSENLMVGRKPKAVKAFVTAHRVKSVPVERGAKQTDSVREDARQDRGAPANLRVSKRHGYPSKKRYLNLTPRKTRYSVAAYFPHKEPVIRKSVGGVPLISIGFPHSGAKSDCQS